VKKVVIHTNWQKKPRRKCGKMSYQNCSLAYKNLRPVLARLAIYTYSCFTLQWKTLQYL